MMSRLIRSATLTDVGSTTNTIGRVALGDISNVGQKSTGLSTTGSVKSIPSVEVPEVDRREADNPQSVTEYVADIYAFLRSEEAQYQPKPDFMDKQTDINEKMRAILVDWLVQVAMKYKLKSETLFATVNLVDRFLEKRKISRKRLQLVGVTAMLIAAKCEEIYPPEIKDLVYITDKAYTRQEILDAEIMMLNTLQWQFNVPTTVQFLDRLHRISGCDEVQRCVGHYFTELVLTKVKMLRYPPSHIAAAAMYLSNKVMRKHPSWPADLMKQSQYAEGTVRICAREMCDILEDAEHSSLTAVRKKYSAPKYHSVAKMQW